MRRVTSQPLFHQFFMRETALFRNIATPVERCRFWCSIHSKYSVPCLMPLTWVVMVKRLTQPRWFRFLESPAALGPELRPCPCNPELWAVQSWSAPPTFRSNPFPSYFPWFLIRTPAYRRLNLIPCIQAVLLRESVRNGSYIVNDVLERGC